MKTLRRWWGRVKCSFHHHDYRRFTAHPDAFWASMLGWNFYACTRCGASYSSGHLLTLTVPATPTDPPALRGDEET